jgi:hypothetical protein
MIITIEFGQMLPPYSQTCSSFSLLLCGMTTGAMGWDFQHWQLTGGLNYDQNEDVIFRQKSPNLLSATAGNEERAFLWQRGSFSLIRNVARDAGYVPLYARRR